MPHLDLSQIFSRAQLVGYLAFVLGVTAFLQRKDRRLKAFLVGECAAYVVHFVLLQNFSAASSAGVSATRTLLSLRYQSKRLAVAVIVVCVALGAVLVRSPAGWLPVVGSCFATWGILTSLKFGIEPSRICLSLWVNRIEGGVVLLSTRQSAAGGPWPVAVSGSAW
jgi:hypothetical protein